MSPLAPLTPPPSEPLAHPFADPVPPLWLYLSFRGRISRRTFWRHGVLWLLLMTLLLNALLTIAGMTAEEADGVANVLLLWPALAVSIKRWHDRNRSGWWVLVNLIPLIGWLWVLIENGALRGTPGPNDYGPAPRV
ncbi:DUF805 domain-containing protein [Ideonella sp. B7]|uniref:DUF805 domain-containing protein n=1 Tax=Ideonella benzenivorans TaxID=2831643 RepID=UPI001CECAB1F|nr:DUF805 domain-containing protein [Ideonella benzenivorans]MCA6216731.1 DUF805 domain-containing protein [Ideonella benzenivorans]